MQQLPDGFRFWRAQLGFAWEPHYQGDVEVGEIEGPFPPDRMKPLSGRAREGRANPRGIPFLYGATRKETAMAEVRPWNGSLISLGVFQTNRPLRVCNLRTHYKRHHYWGGVPRREIDRTVLADLDDAFSRPIEEGEDHADYTPTQVIAEAFKAEGFDGLAYRSSLGPGFNFVFFDVNSANLTSCVLFEAGRPRFTFSQRSNPYGVGGK
jgi:hypothetical protein